jgi:death-on-curing protein
VIYYPNIEEVVAAHARLVARFGGSPGLRDRAALESALARPQSGYYSDLIQQAAALWESLSQNHPFVDGNKRVAITVTAAFLRVNGHRLDFDDRPAYEFLMSLYEGGCFRFAELEKWLRRHAIPTPVPKSASAPERVY